MRRLRAGLLAAAVAGMLVVTGAASSATSVPTGSDHGPGGCERKLDQTTRAVDQAFAARDLPRLLSHYHRDATLINPFGAVRDTTGEIEAAFGALFSAPFLSTVTPVRKVVDGCRTAVVLSDFLLEDPADGSQLRFLAALTYTMEHGRWLVLVDQSTRL